VETVGLFSRAMVACFVLVASTASAQDIKELVGVVPGEVMPEVEASASNMRSPMPFVLFGAPTTLPSLAKVFPSAELYVMKNGTVVGSRWKRAYKTKQDCAAAEATVRSLLRSYVPVDVVGKEKWRYQMQTKDKQIGAGISCRENHGNFHELMIELVHFQRDAELSALIGAGR
jgi:hypothetical protein